MDLVLQETEKSRQMANHIAYTTFAAHGVNNGNLPIGPEVCLHNKPIRPRNYIFLLMLLQLRFSLWFNLIELLQE